MSMKARVIKDFYIIFKRKTHQVKKDQLLEFIPDENTIDERGEIQLDGFYICDSHSPFADEHFIMVDEHAVPDTVLCEQLERLKDLPVNTVDNEILVSVGYDDYAWLIDQAQQAKDYKEWLQKVTQLDDNTGAKQLALLALDRV